MSKYTLAELRNLQEDDELDLSASGINEFPNSIVQLTRLTKLDLSSNSIAFLPQTFCKMTRIVRLDFGNNQLHHLPDSIGLLTSLQHLNLYNNKLEDLPLSFANLKALKWLDLKKNPLNPKLAEIAGKCSTDAECKVAAKKVVDVYMGDRKKAIESAKVAEEKLRAKVQKAQEEEKIRKYQEKKKKLEEGKEKEQKNREAAKAAAQQHTQAQKVHKKEPSPKKRVEHVEHTQKRRGVVGSLFSFLYSIAFYLLIALATSSTIAIGLDCKGYGTPIPGNAPLCKDIQSLSSFQKPSAKFTTNVVNSYSRVFSGYHDQVKPHVAPIQKKVSAQWKEFAKTDIGAKIEKAAYQVHSWLVELFVKVQRFVKQQVDAFNGWWKKDGKKAFGQYVDGFVLGLKMVMNVVADVLGNVFAALSYIALRVKAFFVAWTEGGFNAAMKTLNH